MVAMESKGAFALARLMASANVEAMLLMLTPAGGVTAQEDPRVWSARSVLERLSNELRSIDGILA